MAKCFYTECVDSWQISADATWTEQSLLSYGVPSNAVAEIAIACLDPSYEKYGGVRATSGTLDRKIQIVKSADGDSFATMHVQVNNSGYIDCYAEEFVDIEFTLLGYWLGCEYEEKFETFSPTGDGSWEGYSLSQYGVGSGDVVDITIANTETAASRTIGVRASGSSRQLTFNMSEAEGGGNNCISQFVLASGDTAAIELYAEDHTNYAAYLLGYFSSPPGDYNEANIVFPEPMSQLSWQTLDVGASGVPTGCVAEFVLGQDVTDDQDIGVRSSDSLLDRFVNLEESEDDDGYSCVTMRVNVDDNGEIGQYAEDISPDNPLYQLTSYWNNFNESSVAFPKNSNINCFIYGLNPYIHYIETYTDKFLANDSDTWEEHDLTTYGIPVSTDSLPIVAEIVAINKSTSAANEQDVGIRSVGSNLDRKFLLDAAEGGGKDYLNMLVQVNSAGKIEIYGGSTSYIEFQVIGYWKGATYIEAASGFTTVGDASWNNYELGSQFEDKVVDVVVSNNATVCQSGGIRQVGSSLDRHHSIGKQEGGLGFATMETVASGNTGTIQVYSESASDVSFTLMGYWSTPPGDYNEMFSDITATESSSWHQKDFGISQSSIVEVALENWDAGTENKMGVREIGSSYDRNWEIRETDLPLDNSAKIVRAFVNISSCTYAEIYHETYTNPHHFRVLGYWDNLSLIPTSKNSNIPLFMSGSVGFVNSDIPLWITSNINHESSLYIDGVGVSTSSGDLFTYGIFTKNNDCDLYVGGSGVISYGGQSVLFVHGDIQSSGSMDIFVDSHELVTKQQDLFLKVVDPKNASLDLVLYSPVDPGSGIIREANAVFYLNDYDDSEITIEKIQNREWYVPEIYFYHKYCVGNQYEDKTAGDGTLPFYNRLGKGFAPGQFGTSFDGSINKQQNILGLVANDRSPRTQLEDYRFAGSNSITAAFWMSGSQIPASSQIDVYGNVQTASGAQVNAGWFHRFGEFRPGDGELSSVIPAHTVGLETRGESGLIIRTCVRDVPYTQASGTNLWWGGTSHYGTPTDTDWTWNTQVSGIYYTWEQEWPEIYVSRTNVTFFVIRSEFIPSGDGIPARMDVYLSSDGQPWTFVGSGATGPPASSLYNYDDPWNRYAENAVGFNALTNNWSGGYHHVDVALSEMALWTDENKFTNDELYDMYHVVHTYNRPLGEYKSTVDALPTYIKRTVGNFAYNPVIDGLSSYNPGEICSGLLVTLEVGIGGYGEDASAYLLEERPPSGFYVKDISPLQLTYQNQSDRPSPRQAQFNDPQSGIMEPYDFRLGNSQAALIRWTNHDNNPEHDQRRSPQPTKTFTYKLYPQHYHGVPVVEEFDFAGSGVFFGGTTGSGVFVVEATGDLSGTTSGVLGRIIGNGCDFYISGPAQSNSNTNLYIRTIEKLDSSFIGTASRTPENTDLTYSADGQAAVSSMAGIEYGPSLYVKGPLASTGEMNLFVRGPAGNDRDLYIHGHLDHNTSGAYPSGMLLAIGDGHEFSAQSGNLFILGPVLSSGNVGLYTQAGAFTSRIAGAGGCSPSLSLYSTSYVVQSGTCDMFIKVPETKNSNVNVYVNGPEIICCSGDFVYPHDPDDFKYPSGALSPPLFMYRPIDNISGTLNLFLQRYTRPTFTMYLKTSDNSSTGTMNLFTHGCITESGVSQNFANVKLYIDAIAADYPYTAGGTKNWSMFLKSQSGNLSVTPNWTLFLKADTKTTASGNLYTYGHASGSSPHGIVQTGSCDLVCSADPSDPSRIGYIPFNTDTDPWTLFLKGEQGSSDSFGLYISGSVPTQCCFSGNLFVKGLFGQQTNNVPMYVMGISGIINNDPSGMPLFIYAGAQVYNIFRNLYTHGY